ncbi:unnamed protein product, partial [marine sediment metagenome]
MDGLCNVAGVGDKVTINGTEYHLSIPTPLDFGELERHVVSLRGNPFAELAKCIDEFPPEARHEALKGAADSIAHRSVRATQDEVGAFSGTADGIFFMLYLMLRKGHPEIDRPEKADELIREINEAETAGLMRVVSSLWTIETAAKNLP